MRSCNVTDVINYIVVDDVISGMINNFPNMMAFIEGKSGLRDELGLSMLLHELDIEYDRNLHKKNTRFRQFVVFLKGSQVVKIESRLSGKT